MLALWRLYNHRILIDSLIKYWPRGDPEDGLAWWTI